MSPKAFCLIAILLSAANGNSQTTTFDVASIKPTTLGMADRASMGMTSPNTLTADKVTLRDCIRSAYDLADHQITAPAWVNTERYLIVAKATKALSPSDMRLMLQSLLSMRFHLEFHWETRETQVYALTATKKVRMQASESDTQPMLRPQGAVLYVQHVSMTDFARFLTIARTRFGLDLPILNETGLTGTYDFTLNFARPVSLDPLSERTGTPVDPPILGAVEDQLGLKLVSRKAPVSVLVVDHAERPQEN